MPDGEDHIDVLKAMIGKGGPLAVAYSGGVDSTFLLAVARETLGDGVIAITAHTPLMPDAERRAASETAAALGVRQLVVFPDILGNSEFIANPPHRCYICKHAIFTVLAQTAAAEGVDRLAHGANVDDLKDYRPGMRAAEELGVEAPLVAAGLGKDDIRRYSRQMGLPTWDQPAMACLASRIPYGTPISEASLSKVDRAESVLRDAGFAQCRVRVHGEVARIEVPLTDMPALLAPDQRMTITLRLRSIGFTYVALDMDGYASGSMNRSLPAPRGCREI